MKLQLKKWLVYLLTLCMFFPSAFSFPVNADETGSEESVQAEASEAVNLSGRSIVTDHAGFQSIYALFDGIVLNGRSTAQNAYLTLEHEDGMGSLYFLFDKINDPYTITDNNSGITVTAGENLFYHEFVDLQALFGTAPTSITIRFDKSPVTIFELYVYSPGEVPDTVQKWEKPYDDGADLVLFSAHGDDEHLFFAGLLPYYAGERGCKVQVVYFTDHREDEYQRVHEMLNGLWTVGVRAYPVFGKHPDFFLRNNLEGTYRTFEYKGYTREELLGFVVENVRRFKPIVAVCHDINGEYGHSMHIAYTDLLIKALDVSGDASQFPVSAEKYGVWDIPKTYLHLYEENQIVMDWDQPLEHFDGKTAFQVSIHQGFQCHVSQVPLFSWFYYRCDDAASIPQYNPCYYGLYRSTVGPDTEKNDFFENVMTHEEQARAEAERLEQERLEAERLERERLEAERLERERLEEEERRRIEEEERQRAEEEAEAQRIREEAARRKSLTITIVGLSLGIILTIVLVIIRFKNKKKDSQKKF